MKRRSFFKSAALGGGALALAPLNSCTPSSQSTESEANYLDFELNEATIASLQEKMKSGAITSEQITGKYLDRIEQIDGKGPELRSVIEINPDALDIARMMDKERKEGKVRGPLHGMPVLIKDNIDTGDKMLTTAGSLALAAKPAPDDAFIVRKLRDAGAVILGKTNLSEWANFRSTKSSSGWSGRGRQVRNPYSLDRTPCGSSSGSGVAVAANLCVVAVGTETDGSIVCPAGINGIVGIKPTIGLWSRDGIVPIAHSQDTAGPMARTVTDAALLLGALAEADPDDTTVDLRQPEPISDYSTFLDAEGLKGARIGLAADFYGFSTQVDALMKQAIDTLKAQGAEIIEDMKFKDHDQWGEAEWQEIFELAEKTQGLQETVYVEALKKAKNLTREQGIDQLMDDHHLDALIAPTNGPAWMIDWINGDHFGGGSSEPAAISGYPNITVPAGEVHGLPIGISFFGRAWSEPTLIRLAYAYEQASKHRKVPGFKGIDH